MELFIDVDKIFTNSNALNKICGSISDFCDLLSAHVEKEIEKIITNNIIPETKLFVVVPSDDSDYYWYAIMKQAKNRFRLFPRQDLGIQLVTRPWSEDAKDPTKYMKVQMDYMDVVAMGADPNDPNFCVDVSVSCMRTVIRDVCCHCRKAHF